MTKFHASRSDIRWGLAALFVAVVVFYTVRSKISHTTTLAVPVESGKEPGLAVLSADPFTVRVTFRGAFADLQQLSSRDLRVLLRPRATASGGSERVRVRPGDIHGRPAGVRVIGIEPESVLLTFDRQDEMALPLAEPPIEGRPLRGRVELDYAPREVTVKGARRQLQELKAADYHMQTEPISVVGCLQSFTRTVRIVPPGAAWQSEVSPAEVTVKVNIITEQSTRELRDLPVLVTAPAGRKGVWQVEPPTVQVRLSGRAEVVQAVLPDSLLLTVDGRRAVADEPSVLPVLVHLPPDLKVDAVECDPATVLVFRSEE
jgi:YbbR domain-containing protein